MQLVEASGDTGFWASNLETGESTASVGYYRILGRDPAQPVSYRDFIAMIHPDDRPQNQHIDQVIRSGQPIAREFRIIRADGTVRWIVDRAEVILDKDSKPARAVGLIRDITELHDFKSSLMQSEGRLAAVLQALGAVFWITEPDGRIKCGRQWQDLTGQSDDEMTGDGWLNAIHPADRDRVRDRFAERVTAFATRCRIRRGDGSFGRFEIRGTPVSHGTDGVVRWIVTCTELDTETRSEASVDTAETRLQQALKLTDAQVRGARGILAWSVNDLAHASAVSASTIRRIERGETATVHRRRLALVRKALEDAGIDFLFPQNGKPGVQPR